MRNLKHRSTNTVRSPALGVEPSANVSPAGSATLGESEGVAPNWTYPPCARLVRRTIAGIVKVRIASPPPTATGIAAVQALPQPVPVETHTIQPNSIIADSAAPIITDARATTKQIVRIIVVAAYVLAPVTPKRKSLASRPRHR